MNKNISEEQGIKKYDYTWDWDSSSLLQVNGIKMTLAYETYEAKLHAPERRYLNPVSLITRRGCCLVYLLGISLMKLRNKTVYFQYTFFSWKQLRVQFIIRMKWLNVEFSCTSFLHTVQLTTWLTQKTTSNCIGRTGYRHSSV